MWRAQEVRQSAADRCRRASRIHRQRRKPTDDDAYHMRPKWDTHLERCVREGRIDELWQPKAKPPRETFEGPPPAHVDAPHTMDPGDKLYPAPRLFPQPIPKQGTRREQQLSGSLPFPNP